MPTSDPRRPQRSSGSAAWAWLLVAVALGVGAGWWFWGRPGAEPVLGAQATGAAPAPQQAPSAAAPEGAPAPEEPLHHPVEEIEAPPAPPLESPQELEAAVQQLLGAQQSAAFLQLDDFARRVVATIDNLAREQAPERLWPVQPTPGRFTADGPADAQVQTIAADNASRYRPFVAFAEGVPLDAAVQLYVRLYPLLQAAYEELGYPGRHFNDRLVAVLDHLLATPEPSGPLAVQLTRVAGEVPSTRPWVRYEFADPKLQALSSGQKMLLRMGPENARRLKAVLAGVRQRVATGVRP